MLRSMYSGISGLKVNQTKLDVIGNNIANVGTTAFKAQRIRFQDMMSQNMSQAIGPGLNQGGINPKQIGLGVQIGGIDTIATQGNMQPTGRNLDVAIDGEGYFMVARGQKIYDSAAGITINATENTVDDGKNMNISFTRDGAFTLDSDGNLLTSDGYRVLGYSVSGTGPNSVSGQSIVDVSGKPQVNFVSADSPDLKAGATLQTLVIPEKISMDGSNAPDKMSRVTGFTIENDGQIKATLADGKIAVIGQIATASFKNPGGLQKLGKNLYQNTDNSGNGIIRNGIDLTNPAGGNGKGYGNMMQGALEMSNVDLAEQFTEMIVASRAFQANGKMISTGDEILQDLVNLKR